MKNTMGYGINSFLDHDRPVDILGHLIVGSEGTLAFLASATFRTIPVQPHALTGLLVFDDLAAATGSLPELLESGPATAELLDATSIEVARRSPADARLLPAASPGRQPAALLVEYQEPTAEALGDTQQRVAAAHARLPVSQVPALSADSSARAALWHLRKGLYATVAAARTSGTSALLEDVAVPVGRLLDTCLSLTELFGRHGYGNSVIFGHAKDGNLHFMITDRFEGERLAAYRAFTEEMVDLILEMGGTLKAEHGTGRTMAPFVRRQYGDELYQVMHELKRLCDPAGVLAPGVILDDDPDAHVRHLKTTPTVEAEVDRCVECGYCEPVCPSRDLSTTPRQRIVLRRALAHARAAGDTGLVAEIEHAQRHDVVDTCAADGMCQTACPVLINTGDLVKRLRAERQSRAAGRAGETAARHWSGVTRVAARGLDAAALLPAMVPAAATRLARSAGLAGLVPQWTADVPRGGQPRTGRPADAGTAFFPSCTGSMFGGTAGVTAAVLALCGRAGVEVSVPDGIDELCCGTPWSSKGLDAGHHVMAAKVSAAASRWQQAGARSVVCDASSCTEGLRGTLAASSEASGMHVLDAVDFVLDELVPRLTIRHRVGSALLHPTCSAIRAGREGRLAELAAAVAEEVVVPASWGCCGFAGDRGLLVPELTESATWQEAAEIATRSYDAYLSDNRTCEIGMTRATNRPFRHVIELVEELTR
jgi:D-lactate dehydrogenase